MQNTVCNLIDDKGESDWGMSTLEVDNIPARRTTWSPLWTASTEKMTKSKTTITNRNENQLLYQPALVVVFDRFLLNNNGISAADKEAIGIHQRVTTTTPVSDSTQASRITITYGEALQHIVNVRNAATGRKEKPKGVGFMELWYKISNPAPMG